MYEVEMKVRAAHDPVREQLAAMDTDHVGVVTQVDTYYNAPDRDFAATDEALRVRRETDHGEGAQGERAGNNGGEHVLLTYKGPLVDDHSKTREEAETRVADEEAVGAILAGLGYDPAATVCKERDRYQVAGCRVTLDRVADLGTFVEVERHDAVTEENIDRARETVTGLLATLGLDPGESIQTSYLGLLLAQQQ
jgi:adenylate cyclase class 2